MEYIIIAIRPSFILDAHIHHDCYELRRGLSVFPLSVVSVSNPTCLHVDLKSFRQSGVQARKSDRRTKEANVYTDTRTHTHTCRGTRLDIRIGRCSPPNASLHDFYISADKAVSGLARTHTHTCIRRIHTYLYRDTKQKGKKRTFQADGDSCEPDGKYIFK